MCVDNRQKALEFLQTLVGQPLTYAVKYYDTEVYEFQFGEPIECVSPILGRHRELGTHILHVLCRFKVIWRNGISRSDIYHEDSNHEEFASDIQRLMGLKVNRVALSDKNDLWLDFGTYWIVFATFENAEESWRIFSRDETIPHLVASDTYLDF